MRVFIYACEDFYEGLHGVNTYGVVEVDNLKEINDYGREWSEEIIDSYNCIENYCDDYEDIDSEDYYDICIEHLMWSAWKIRDDVTESTSDLDAIAAKIGDEAFVEEYCEELEGY